MGLKLLVDEPYRLPSLITVRVPEGLDEAALRYQDTPLAKASAITTGTKTLVTRSASA
ncbi:hypothetical protein [Acetomicrobium sp. S15 = DSM 107314]|uniref:hypothetical protein n=1 Tax=Acetomicrobium sp. S15 = DSM 107314 TaxID=2529858 RepID=UPI0018E1AE6C|nr:hypothetical protein [Acetomicrobium sp. S15 = DSM 107314]